MGAHPKAPSRVDGGDMERSLIDLIADDPSRLLGTATAERFGGLPFLFKFLAAGEPLSIQAHPTKAQAEEGFARENRNGPGIAAPERNYKDDNHKPEILCALTPFWALRGFRPWEEIQELAAEAGSPLYAALAAQAQDLEEFFASLMHYEKPAALIEELVAAAAEKEGTIYDWIGRLNRFHPGDTGVAAPLYLNLLRLEPGQALYLDAGELHAYLEGLGVELMANSDNVLRGGLTVKHVDVPELMATLSFQGAPPEILHAEVEGREERYHTPAPEFELSAIRLDGGEYSVDTGGRCQILACTEGSLTLEGGFSFKPGESFFVSADHGGYTIAGSGLVYRAAVPE